MKLVFLVEERRKRTSEMREKSRRSRSRRGISK